MKKLLRFEVKQNLRRASRIYVKSHDLKINYGYFHTDNPASFDGWALLSPEQKNELNLFIQNIEAVNSILGNDASNKLTDFRFRLPIDLISAINDLNLLLIKEDVKINIFESAVTSMIQQLKIATTKLHDEKKHQALTILNKVGLADYKKLDLTSPIQAVFSEILAIRDKSERLHKKADLLFSKDKSYSPKAIEGMATGETTPAKWLVSCAIDLLIDERLPILKSLLSANDIFMLWAKPLLDNDTQTGILIDRATLIGMNKLIDKINDYHSS